MPVDMRLSLGEQWAKPSVTLTRTPIPRPQGRGKAHGAAPHKERKQEKRGEGASGRTTKKKPLRYPVRITIQSHPPLACACVHAPAIRDLYRTVKNTQNCPKKSKSWIPPVCVR